MGVEDDATGTLVSDQPTLLPGRARAQGREEPPAGLQAEGSVLRASTRVDGHPRTEPRPGPLPQVQGHLSEPPVDRAAACR